MSVDYEFFPVLGYRVEEGMLKKFEVVVPEESHSETRFDPITGTPHEVGVVDCDVHRYYEADGRKFDLGELDEDGEETDPGNYDVSGSEFEEFCKYVAKKVGCEFLLCGNSMVEYFGYFCPHGKVDDEVPLTPWGRIAVHGSLPLFPLIENMAGLRTRLTDFGIPVEGAEVAVGWFAS